MRDPLRIPRILGKLAEVWANNPDQRFNQLILNLIPHGMDAWFLEDDRYESNLDQFLEAGQWPRLRVPKYPKNP